MVSSNSDNQGEKGVWSSSVGQPVHPLPSGRVAHRGGDAQVDLFGFDNYFDFYDQDDMIMTIGYFQVGAVQSNRQPCGWRVSLSELTNIQTYQLRNSVQQISDQPNIRQT